MPPIHTIWRVECDSSEVVQQLQLWLSSKIRLARVIVDEIRTAPDGVEQVRRVPHRLSDYFDAIRILPDNPENAASFRIDFHRKSDAGRYWKDLMVRILREIQRDHPEATVSRESVAA